MRLPPDSDTQAAIALSCSALVDMLDELYPAKSPRESDTERRIWMDAGKRELIDSLVYLRAEAPVRRL